MEEQLEIKKPKIVERWIQGERVFLAKSHLFGWSVIRPNVIDWKPNWKNLLIGGSWLKFAIMVGIVAVILGFFYEYSTTAQIANECLSNNSTIILP